MPVQELLDLARIEVLPAADHHVLDTADDVAVAVRIDRGEVAGVHPAGLVDDLGRPLLVAPVPEHHRIAAGAEFTRGPARHDMTLGIDDLHFEMRMSAPDS